MKKKVYCRECKYYAFKFRPMFPEMSPSDFNEEVKEESCTHKKAHVTTDTYYSRMKSILEPSEKNANNDCKDFEKGKAKNLDYDEVEVISEHPLVVRPVLKEVIDG